MHSPPAEWVLDGAYFVAKDFLRARGEADGDTASECLRDRVLAMRNGPALFTLAWVAFALWFWDHILSDRQGRMVALGDPRDAPTSGGPTTT